MLTERIASCPCGQLQARVTADPIRVSVCHCLNCQRRSGSVFATQARFDASAVTATGEAREFVLAGDGGSRATFRFCPHCGATVYYTSDAMAGFTIIPVGAFADPTFPAPGISVYEQRMHGWVSVPSAMDHIA